MKLFIMIIFDPDVPKRKEKRQMSCDTEDPINLLSGALVKFMGTVETSSIRSDAVRRTWDYIDYNKLIIPRFANAILSKPVKSM